MINNNLSRLEQHVAAGARVLELEQQALAETSSRLDVSFGKAVEAIAGSQGRVIVSGIGKSGLIARKIAATMTSTGTPAFFLHPVEGAHGDLGIVGEQDVAILLSKSGETEEIISLLNPLKRFGVSIISITSNLKSTLAINSDIALDGWVKEEACPHDLAPTSSTTVALALGDALAIALLEAKGFEAADFARLHPGGSLGKRLLTRVREVMVSSELPTVFENTQMRETIIQISSHRGLAIVTDSTGKTVLGVVTAGDLSRLINSEPDFMNFEVREVMNPKPKLAAEFELGSAVVHRMEQFGIISMPVVDDSEQLVGVVHLHDLMRSGVI